MRKARDVLALHVLVAAVWFFVSWLLPPDWAQEWVKPILGCYFVGFLVILLEEPSLTPDKVAERLPALEQPVEGKGTLQAPADDGLRPQSLTRLR